MTDYMSKEDFCSLEVGDKVTIRSDINSGEHYGKADVYFADGMRYLRGKECTVKIISGKYTIRIDEDDDWVFCREMLEPYEIQQEVVDVDICTLFKV